jgi:hypothetical protein
MASYKEMLALGRDPVRVRAVARRLLACAEDWTEWERDLLEGFVAEYGSDALTARQREKLVELRNWSDPPSLAGADPYVGSQFSQQSPAQVSGRYRTERACRHSSPVRAALFLPAIP